MSNRRGARPCLIRRCDAALGPESTFRPWGRFLRCQEVRHAGPDDRRPGGGPEAGAGDYSLRYEKSITANPHRQVMATPFPVFQLAPFFAARLWFPGKSVPAACPLHQSREMTPLHFAGNKQQVFLMKQTNDAKRFPIVCVGGSAGGLDAYIRLLRHLPADLGVAIVIVNHQRNFSSNLHQILPNVTSMPVKLITDKLDVKPNHVFVIPSKRDLHVSDGEFVLKPLSKPWGWPDVITVFLRSLAANWDGQLIAVIVSGYDGDGAEGLCKIREAGGIAIAQKLDTAEHPDMPVSAIASGCIDYILSPEEIAKKIVQIMHDSPSKLAQSIPSDQWEGKQDQAG